MRIKIPNHKNENVEYELDTEKALEAGILREVVSYPLNVGDVYISNKGLRPVLLVKTDYYNQDNSICLLGLEGLEAYQNINPNLTEEGAKCVLATGNYKFSHNINKNVERLIKNPNTTILT